MATESNENNPFLGTGWSFPPTFKTSLGGQVEMTSDEVDIDQSLEILLSTALGERVMLPEYGTNLERLLFEPLNTTTITYMRKLLTRAILKYEPRIEVEQIDLEGSNSLEGLVNIRIDYRVRTTNSRSNYVYPFYKAEGTNL